LKDETPDLPKRATSKTTYTIYKKETQLLAYADDIDIVGRSQSAVRDTYLVLEKEAAKVKNKLTKDNIYDCGHI
jgi:hypothetical protein